MQKMLFWGCGRKTENVGKRLTFSVLNYSHRAGSVEGWDLFTAHSKVGEENLGELKGKDSLTVLRMEVNKLLNKLAGETGKMRDWFLLHGQAFCFPRQTHIPHTHAPTHIYSSHSQTSIGWYSYFVVAVVAKILVIIIADVPIWIEPISYYFRRWYNLK